MNFPNYPDKHNLNSILNPEDIVGYRRHLGRLPNIQVPDGILFCLERGMPKRMRWRVPVRKVGSMLGDLYVVKRNKHKAGVMTDFGGGAPIVVELAEEMVVLGAKRMLMMTWGGALQPDLHPGDIVVCDRAIRDEGTSHHYLPHSKYIHADKELVQRLTEIINQSDVRCRIGTTWTTDAPYRETYAEVEQYQSEGVLTVEMESAGLFTVGQVRDVQTASAVVIMDSLAEMRWEVPDKLDRIEQSLKTLYQAAIQVFEEF